MDVYMTDNEKGQSIVCILNADKSVSVPHKSWGETKWHTFDNWAYPLRDPSNIYEMYLMAKHCNV